MKTDRARPVAAGYEAELRAWAGASVPIAAALNSIQGQVLTLTKHRGWNTPLDSALFGNHIDRPTLDAMLTAARESFSRLPPLSARQSACAGRVGAGLLRSVRPGGHRHAGSGPMTMRRRFIVGAVSAPIRPRCRPSPPVPSAKIGLMPSRGPASATGAFCMWLRGDESRILSNYKPAFSGMSTLAHELGHGYHNLKSG